MPTYAIPFFVFGVFMAVLPLPRIVQGLVRPVGFPASNVFLVAVGAALIALSWVLP